MALKLTKNKPAEANVTTENKTKGQITSATTEPIDTSELSKGATLQTLTPWADIGFALSYTHNLGDYKSTRVEVSLSLPCPVDELEDGYAKAKEFVEGKLQPIVDELVSN
jgi:hypothetical protein